jgi:hypothetical protein
MIKVIVHGSFKNTDSFLQRMQARLYLRRLEKFGAEGIAALQAATPKDTGRAAHAWSYEIVQRHGYYSIHWLNSEVEEPGTIPLVVLLQYGHATRNGGYVQGIDFINPALRPIFTRIAEEAWKEVTM